MLFFISISLSAGIAAAQYPGVATFNNYAGQGNTVCGPKSGISGTYGAAIGDLSPNLWSGATCSGSVDYNQWYAYIPVSWRFPLRKALNLFTDI